VSGRNTTTLGLFRVSLGGTKSRNHGPRGSRGLLEEIDAILAEPPERRGDAGAPRTRSSTLSCFRFDSRDKILRQQISYEFYGYPADFLERYAGRSIGSPRTTWSGSPGSTSARVRSRVLVVGKPKDFDRPLET